MDRKFAIILYILSLTAVMISCGNSKTTEKIPLPNPVDAFIAHAGGQIEGHNYTNSLEALDLSYSKGCRLLELDMLVTSDGKLVAAHDWIHFKTATSYIGEQNDTPLTETEFLSQKLHNKFTPMNMDSINRWFEKHSDAILVTDKINDPKLIAESFNYKDRVIMELFSWEAVEEAISLGITPLVSENLIFGTENIEGKLDDLHIKYIGMSRLRIADNKEFLKKLREKGIRNYVWQLEEPINGISAEQYVWNNEMEYCYGMYVNNMDLLTTLLNCK